MWFFRISTGCCDTSQNPENLRNLERCWGCGWVCNPGPGCVSCTSEGFSGEQTTLKLELKRWTDLLKLKILINGQRPEANPESGPYWVQPQHLSRGIKSCCPSKGLNIWSEAETYVPPRTSSVFSFPAERGERVPSETVTTSTTQNFSSCDPVSLLEVQVLSSMGFLEIFLPPHHLSIVILFLSDWKKYFS